MVITTPTIYFRQQMASGRVGGAHSKISGQVGDVVYQIRKNADGTYSQVVNAKGEYTETQTTPKLQAQRMVTSMVESMMRDLKEVGRISMQSAANKSKSLNAFSHYNLMRVAQDCKANWYGNNQFVYPKHSRFDINVQDLGGPYMISSGTLQFELFDSLYHTNNPQQYLKGSFSNRNEFYAVKFLIPSDVQTFGQLLRRWHLTRLDAVVLCGLRYYFDQPDPEEDGVEYLKHNYLILTPNAAISDGQLISDDLLSQAFLINYSLAPVVGIAKDNSFVSYGWKTDIYDHDETFYYWAGFSISYLDGKKKISSSQYSSPDGGTFPWLRNAAPTNVFGSWMDEPGNTHYPSPFI